MPSIWNEKIGNRRQSSSFEGRRDQIEIRPGPCHELIRFVDSFCRYDWQRYTSRLRDECSPRDSFGEPECLDTMAHQRSKIRFKDYPHVFNGIVGSVTGSPRTCLTIDLLDARYFVISFGMPGCFWLEEEWLDAPCSLLADYPWPAASVATVFSAGKRHFLQSIQRKGVDTVGSGVSFKS